MIKKFTLTVEIQDKNTPQKWEFLKDVSGIEQLAIWMIVKNLADKQIELMLNAKQL